MLVGKTISHYRILALIGAGGMGEVYKAEDTRLDKYLGTPK
jgi:serine/threonine protein kinase